ncbi:MAG: hypothetical protein EWM50_02020 [Gottschalkiaceae bacterium]|nr:MAG: hypothetical protein EWM50_02020 [Gottschalkiaceae bacterium]
MFPNTQTISLLPKEIQIYRDYINNQTDPIKREVFNYSLVSYISKSIEPFPVNAECLYEINSNHILQYFALSYIRHRQQHKNSLDYTCIRLEDLFYTSNFIKVFFDTLLPIKKESLESIFWIFPKLEIKYFVSNNFFEGNFNSYFYDDTTLIKFIMIISEFSQYEVHELADSSEDYLKTINYPTLILANIGLYEKGIIKIKDENNTVGIYLDLNPKQEECQIFSNNSSFLKQSILNVINKTQNLKYNMEDFL